MYARGWPAGYGELQTTDAWLALISDAGHTFYLRPPQSLSVPLPAHVVVPARDILDARDDLAALWYFEERQSRHQVIANRLARSLFRFANHYQLQLPAYH